jgi:hypothetical protein
MGTPVEIEFAVNLSSSQDNNKEFAVLQMRPLVVNQETDELSNNNVTKDRIICQSKEVLGNGLINNIQDIIMVNVEKFERTFSREVASEVNQFNTKMLSEHKPYLLIGIGRWGTMDPWLGIPVTWSQISGAKVIVETGMKDMIVEPSQGSHFFQNLTSFSIGYFTINSINKHNFIDWDWLNNYPVFEEKKFVKHIKLPKPLTIKINAHKSIGLILKPDN